jgi:predicted molibdopterin-dependent oxidoreductase YjgC
MIALTVDGQKIDVPDGSTVLEASRKANIYIPTLCYHPSLTPWGGCRLCIVEIEGMKGYPTACTTPALGGMRVKTQREEIQSLRRQILELILSEHPCVCLTCERGEECEKYQECIRKGSLVTGCKFCPKDKRCELQDIYKYLGLREISFPIRYRGLPVERNDPFYDRDYNLCILCGRCVRACQEIRGDHVLSINYRGSDSIVSPAFHHSHMESNCEFCGTCIDVCPTGALSERARKWEGQADDVKTTICPLCSMGCQIKLETKAGRVIGALPDQHIDINDGQSCVKGRFAPGLIISHKDRISAPFIRKNGKLKEVKWDEAIDFAANALSQYKKRKFALISSPYCTNEEHYIFRKFTEKAMGSPNFSPLGIYHDTRQIGKKILTKGSITDIPAAKSVLILADVTTTHPVLGVWITRAMENGAKIVLIHPKNIYLSRWADVFIQNHPTSESFILLNIMKSILDNGLERDVAGKDKRNLAKIKCSLSKLEFNSLEVDSHAIREAATFLAQGKPTAILYSDALFQQPRGKEILHVIDNLSLLLGSDVVLPLFAEGNAASCLFNANKEKKGFLSYTKIFEGIHHRQIEALYAMGGVPIQDRSPLKFLLLQDPYYGEQTDIADVVFPSCTFAEKEGTFINFEGKPHRINSAIEPLGKSKPDWWIICEIAKRLGATGFEFNGIEEIQKEMARSDISQDQGERKYTNFSMETLSYAKVNNPDYPLTLMIESDSYYYRSLSFRHKIKGYRVLRDPGVIEMNLADMNSRNIGNGEEVDVISPHAKIKARALASEKIKSGTASMVFHLSHNSPVLLVRPYEQKYCSVKVEKHV